MLSTVLTKTQRRRLAELKPVKHQHHKTGGSCGTVTPANQADCYRSHGQKPTKEALEFEKKAKAHRQLEEKPKATVHKVEFHKVEHEKVGGSCGTVTPANQAACYRSHGQKPTPEALEAEKKAKAHRQLEEKPKPTFHKVEHKKVG